MYAFEWYKKPRQQTTPVNVTEAPSYSVKSCAPLLWAEHCLECAVPECFDSCVRYRGREDGRCRLFANGIRRIKTKSGILGHSAYLTFEGWSKLQAYCNTSQRSKLIIRLFASVFFMVSVITTWFSRIFERKKRFWFSLCINEWLRERIVHLLGKQGADPAEFLIDIENMGEAFTLIVEVRTKNESKYRTSILFSRGRNIYVIPYVLLNITKDARHFILIYPESTVIPRSVCIHALDFVVMSYKQTASSPDRKIKCVVWDLDNTLWDGILIEDDCVRLNPKAVEIIKELDNRGIISSIASKNDCQTAREKLRELDMDDYFIMPQINWDPKSVNIRRISKNINIGIDAIAFVDDNIFEREEVSNAHPNVLCIDALNMDSILSLPSFDIPVTDESKMRRKSYKMLELQRADMEFWDGSIDEFLKKCKIELTIGTPRDDELPRCCELMQRANQLNLSARRLTKEEIHDICGKDNYHAYVLHCRDRYGDYGLIGFSIVKADEIPTVTDFVISCRVANKKVEHAYLAYLALIYKRRGYESLYLDYSETIRNGPIFKALSDMGMQISLKGIRYISLKGMLSEVDVIRVIERK